MRLGQLARKLALRPDQIIEFLAKKNIQIEEGSNTRLEDLYVALVVKKFAPQGFDITVQEIAPQEAIQPSETLAISPIETDGLPNHDIPTETPESEERSEVIKAPKIELSGLRVLGKIELPEPKKKEQPITEPSLQGGEEKKSKQPERQRSQNRNPRTNPRQVKNPVALQREREELEAQRKREAAKEIEKEKRAQHYYNKVKVVAPVKAPKREQIEEEIAEPVPQPKTLLGRFFRWFTT